MGIPQLLSRFLLEGTVSCVAIDLVYPEEELSLGASYVAILDLKSELIDFGQDVKDITVKGLEVVRCCSQVYLEAYSSVLTVEKEVLVDASVSPVFWGNFYKNKFKID